MRSIGIGLVLTVVVIAWNTYVEYIAHTARMNITHFPIALFVPYTLLTLGNAVLRRLGIRRALSSAEILVALAMGLVGAAVPAYGLISFFLGMIAAPYYLASPENQWQNYFHPYLPDWLVPSNEGGAMQWLFEGLPSQDMPIPWEVWVAPLMGWMVFIGAVALGSICLAVMLRKQWAEHERLAYPILNAASDLAEAEERRPLLNSGFFWFGVAIPFFILSWNMISYFFPGFPRISLGPGWMLIGTYFPRIHVRLNFYTVGFAYFANLDVLFSIWAFYLLYCTQVSFYRRIGFSLSDRGGWGDATTTLQAAGAFLALVMWGLWLARDHLRDVFLKAFRPSHPVDDREEMLSYRFCAFGLMFSVVLIVCWLRATGMSWPVSCAFALGIFITHLGVARVIAETGVVYYSMPIGLVAGGTHDPSGKGFLPFVFGGTEQFDASTQTALRLVDSIRSQGKAMFMPPLVHAARIGGLIRSNKRFLALGIGLALIVGIGSAIVYSLYLGYTYGAYNFHDFPFTRYPPRTYDGLVAALKVTEPWETKRYYFLGSGAVVFVLMSVLRYRFSWWPLAPIGMVVPPTHAVHSMFPIFVTWGLKTVLMRIGGIDLYRRLRPFFVGLLVGHALGVLLSFVVDQIWFPGQGHPTHSW